MDLTSCSSPVVKLDSSISTLFRRGQIITKVSDVIRELVDNSIDAGSGRIQVLLDNYGLDKIEVRDDGHGIHQSQIKSAVSGGYSSKLEDINHLSCGSEYGFRGEALSSICSFGAVTIITKTETEPHAVKFTLDDTGKVVGQSRTGNGRGTTVTVKDLFSLFPVRRNLGKEKWRTVAELKEIEHYLKSVGLANPTVYLNLAHNGNSIWNKPVLKTTEEALGSVLGIQLAKQLSKCGPIDIPSNYQHQHMLTQLECHLPKAPIDAKLMTFSSNKMCIILLNRRRVQISRLEKMLQQYIFGAIQSGLSQVNLKGKYPVALVKITAPSALVDFNREINKSKVFLQNENQILEEMEALLKNFYPVDFSAIKENIDHRIQSNPNGQEGRPKPLAVDPIVAQEKAVEPCINTDSSSIAPKVSSVSEMPAEELRTQNILAFLEDIPRVSKENFSKSPAKTSGFEKKQISDGNGLANSIQKEVGEMESTIAISTAMSSSTSAATSSSFMENDLTFGRMKDAGGNLENSTVVHQVPQGQPDHAPSKSYAQLPMQNFYARNSGSGSISDTEFYARLQSCHSEGSRAPLFDSPAPKRHRANLVAANGALCYSMLDQRSVISERGSSVVGRSPAPRKSPRQITLDSFSSWRKPNMPMGTDFRSASYTTTPTSSRPVTRSLTNEQEQLAKSLVEDNWVRGTDNLIWGSFTPNPKDSPASPFRQLMPVPIPKVPGVPKTGQNESKKPTTPKRSVPIAAAQTEIGAVPLPVNTSSTDVPCLTQTVNSSLILKKSKEITAFISRRMDTVSDSETPLCKTTTRLICKLPEQPLHVVQIDSLLGVFSVSNLLELAPSIAENVSSSTDCSKLDEETIQKLLTEFPNLSTDEFTEEMVSRVFTLLKDFAPEEDESF